MAALRLSRNQSNLDGCLEQDAVPPETIMGCFDALTPRVRAAINQSPYKLCAACVAMYGGTVEVVRMMEERIRAAEQT